MERPVRIDPATKFVRSLEGDYYMLREAAELLGVSQRVLRHYIQQRNKDLSPSFSASMGKVRIYLYTLEDVNRIRDALRERSVVYKNEGRIAVGRPPRFTSEQRKIRQRKFSMANYYIKRSTSFEESGDIEKATEALNKAQQIYKELREE